MTLDEALGFVKLEMEDAQRVWPVWPRDVIHQAAIVGEEAGELLQAAVSLRYGQGDAGAVRDEAIQTAAMALRLLVNFGG